MKIRAMTPQDAAAVLELVHQLGYDIDSSSVEQVISFLADSSSYAVVAETDSGIVGWVHAYVTVLVQYPRQFAEIGGLVVDQSKRGAGIGRALLHAVEDWARAKGLAEVRLHSNTERQDAHAFYDRLGYQNEKTSFTFTKRLGSRQLTPQS